MARRTGFLRRFVSCLTILAVLIGFLPVSSYLSAFETGAAFDQRDDFFKILQESYDSRIVQAQGTRNKSGTAGKDTADIYDAQADVNIPSEESKTFVENSHIVVFDRTASGEDLQKLLDGHDYEQLGPSSSRTFLITFDDMDMDKFIKKAGGLIVSAEKNSTVTAGDIGEISDTGKIGAIKTQSINSYGTYPYDDDLMDQQWALESVDLDRKSVV